MLCDRWCIFLSAVRFNSKAQTPDVLLIRTIIIQYSCLGFMFCLGFNLFMCNDAEESFFVSPNISGSKVVLQVCVKDIYFNIIVKIQGNQVLKADE